MSFLLSSKTWRPILLAVMSLTCLLALASPGQAVDLSPWLLTTFDAGAGFNTGNLSGQGGWVTGARSPSVVSCGADVGAQCGGSLTMPGRGQVLVLNPNPGSGFTRDVGTSVPQQGGGFHVIELDAMVTGATEPSVGKIEVQTNPGGSWDKKFQIYFGTSIRVNYSSTGASQVIVATTQMGRWYHIRCNLNIATGGLNVWVDDVLATPTAITVGAGPIVGVAMTGWEFRAGKVYIDNLAAQQLVARLNSPGRGTTVAGTATVTAAASAGTLSSADFYVDGALQSTVTSAPFQFQWNTAGNPYPLPNHGGFSGQPLAYGYFRNQWKGQQVTTDGCCFLETAPYTNLYYADTRSDYEISSGEPISVWLPRMAAGLQQAFNLGKQILVNLEIPYACTGDQGSTVTWCADMDQVLATVQPFWSRVVAVELADEPAWSQNATKIQAAINSFNSSRAARGLSPVPIGLTYAHASSLSATVLSATTLQFVSIEAYLNPPGTSNPYEFSPLSQVNRQRLISQVQAQRNIAVSANKLVLYIAQAYTRNYGWADANLVRDLQPIPYLLAANDPWVMGVVMFSYLRASGSREISDLLVPQRLVGNRLLGGTLTPPAGNGPRTLAIRATDTAGNTSWDFLKVFVQN